MPEKSIPCERCTQRGTGVASRIKGMIGFSSSFAYDTSSATLAEVAADFDHTRSTCEQARIADSISLSQSAPSLILAIMPAPYSTVVKFTS